MLIAQTKTKELIQADKVESSGHFFCPGCEEKVILKRGKIVIPHFAHVKKEKCTQFSEGETKEHIEGKMALYTWLKNEKMDVKLEAYLSELDQRPDILIQSNNHAIAIEFQCSPISIKSIRQRTEGYTKNGYTVLWVLGKKLQVNKQLTALQKACLHTFNSDIFYLFQFNTDTNQLDVLSHFESGLERMKYKKKSYAYLIALNKVKNSIKIEIPVKLKKTDATLMMKKRLAMMSYYKNQKSRQFFSLLYQDKENLHTVPLELFQIVPSEWMIQSFTYEWKYLILKWLDKLPPYKVITKNVIQQKIEEMMTQKQLKYYHFPNIAEDKLVIPIIEFLDSLALYNVLKKISPLKWKVANRPENKKNIKIEEKYN